MKHIYEHYAFCPRCGERYRSEDFDAADFVFHCRACRYDFYQNSVPSATGVVPCKSDPAKVLLIQRGTPPAIGKRALPGGILRLGESPADGARREVLEEIHLDLRVERLLCTTMVDYEYRGMRVAILEIAFQMEAAELAQARTSEEACDMGFYDVSDVLRESSELAFPEQINALRAYRDRL